MAGSCEGVLVRFIALLTHLHTINGPKTEFMGTTSQNITNRTEKPIRNRSIESRASEKEADTIARWAKSEGMNVSDWIMKSNHSYTTIKNNKEILLDYLRKESLIFFR
jgi:hypothetical protein